MAQRFTATKDFECDVTKSHYVAGMSYTIRDGNTALAERVAGWVKEGKAEMVLGGAPVAQVSGSAEIVDKQVEKAQDKVISKEAKSK